jgi:hypothetical protein
MNLSYKVGLIGALICIIFQFIKLYAIVLKDEHLIIELGFYSLVLLISISYSILIQFRRIRNTSPSFIFDLKNGIKTAALFTLIIAPFSYTYFKWINPEFLENKIEKAESLKVSMYQTAQEQKSINPDLYYNKSAEDLTEMQEENFKDTFTPYKAFIMLLLGTLILGIIYSFFITGLNRGILSRLE